MDFLILRSRIVYNLNLLQEAIMLVRSPGHNHLPDITPSTYDTVNIIENHQPKNAFTYLCKSVKNSLISAGRDKIENTEAQNTARLQDDIARNRITDVNQKPETIIGKQTNLLQSRIKGLQGDLEFISAKVDTSTEKPVLSDKVTRALTQSLKESAVHDAELGRLYLSILNEEIAIAANTCHSSPEDDNRSFLLTPEEALLVKKCTLEKKLAVMDFCLKILRIHAQADWASSARFTDLPPVDEMLNNSLDYANTIPLFVGEQGRDPESGLYHEMQYEASGTCTVHANNHYLASWCEREKRPFLPLTPRRLELLFCGIKYRLETEIKEMSKMSAQCGGQPGSVKDKSHIIPKLGEFTILLYKSNIIDYNKKLCDGSFVASALSSNFLTLGVIDIVNQLYSLPKRISSEDKSFKKWETDSKQIREIEQQDSLICTFDASEASQQSGHAVCFTKKNNIWYLQDSNFPEPIQCSPGDFIQHAMHPERVENLQELSTDSENYAQIYDLDKHCEVQFHHFEPKMK